MLLLKKKQNLLRFFSLSVHTLTFYFFVFQRNLTFVESGKMSDKTTNNSICNSSTAQIVFRLNTFQSRASQTLLCIQKMWHLVKMQGQIPSDWGRVRDCVSNRPLGNCSSVNHTLGSKVLERPPLRQLLKWSSAFKFVVFFLNVDIMIWQFLWWNGSYQSQVRFKLS